jgi:protease-4
MESRLAEDLVRIAIIAVTGIVAFSIGLWIWGSWSDGRSGYYSGISDGYCNIAVVPLVGDILPYSGANKDGLVMESDLPPTTNADDFSYMIRAAQADPNIAGILVSIDSPGGTPVASEIMADALKRSGLPVAALIREIGASGAYMAATGAGTIIASPFSDVGSIGVTMSYLENTGQNEAEGLDFVSLTSAPFKDTGNPNRALTAEERALLERDLDIYHDQFVNLVAANRNMPKEEVAKLADGSSMPGTLALEKGLIDALGDKETAREWFAGQLDMSQDDVRFCE